MVAFNLTVKLPDFQQRLERIQQAINLALERESRYVLNQLRTIDLDAPPGFSPDKLHRITGNLADTAYVRRLE